MRARGFTLIELTISLMILTILLSYSLSFTTLFSTKNKAQVVQTELKNSIRYARAFALANRKTVKIIPLENNDWSTGVKLINNSTLEEIHRWVWDYKVINVKWNGFQSNNYLQFSADLRHSAASGHFTLSLLHSEPIIIIVNRLGHSF